MQCMDRLSSALALLAFPNSAASHRPGHVDDAETRMALRSAKQPVETSVSTDTIRLLILQPKHFFP
jgi:hypothetical protein